MFTPVNASAVDAPAGCTATRGALVAVDFAPFGGTLERGCDPTPTTGYDLLHDAGFTTTGTQHDGPGFICRIGKGPSGTQYPTPAQESCVLTPPASAYWSYWTAAPGQQDWTYSRFGAMDRRLKDGDVDAWVFGGTTRPSFTPADVRASGPGTPDPGTPPTGAPGDIALTKATAWLKSAPTDDPTLATETAYALAATGDTALGALTSGLAARTGAYAYPNGALDATAAARLALLAESAGQDPRAFGGHDLVGDLAKNVCASGPAPGCTAEGDFRGAGYTDGQALAVLALVRADVKPPATAVTRLTQLQCADGGFTSVLIRPGENCDGDPATTGLAALVLHQAGGHDTAVTKARTHLTRTQRADGAFPGYTGSPTGSVYATAYAAQALRALGEKTRADAAVGWLSREQLDGGGFGFEEGASEPAALPTASAVLAGAGTSLATLTWQAPYQGPDLKKGVAYLTSAANLAQGRYYRAGPGTARADFGLTVDGAYALAATGLDNARLRGIVDFLDGLGKDGEGRTVNDWTGVGTRYAAGGSIGKTALLAEAVGRDPRDFAGHDLVAALGKAVCTKPSPAPDRSCAAKGAYTYAPSVFSQALAVIAQLRAGEKATEPVAYLKSLQQRGGAWPSLIPATGDADVDSTAVAAMALDLAGEKRAVDKALAWIAGRQVSDGGFPGAAGTSVNSTALAVQGLSLDAVTYGEQIARARKFLAAQQNADGGFNVAKEGQRGSDLRASTQAVGGATGVSFAELARSLDGTSPQPTPTDSASSSPTPVPTASPSPSPSGSVPPVITPDGSGGGGGSLASTGVQAGALAAIALLLVLTGWRVTVLARRRVRR
ncbi:prenyltransferase/squalene oxidase repeat-containing protein [Streptomyces sp. 4F14]|uniref:prenyltransferase/squalene oxidase repeat-containing protein n=1 Tax=Streptomyces sp. 4F14 TaxID=3394380 RepID=UPI003A8405A4